MKLKGAQIWELIREFLAINVGMAVYSLGWAGFLLPYHLTSGGMAGMFANLQYVTHFSMSWSLLITNAILLLIALKTLGWKFVLKTAYAVMALSTFLSVGQSLMTDDSGAMIQLLGDGQDSMACVIGAIMNGVGIAIVFLNGGSTGGWDIIAAVVNKYKNVSLGRMLLYLDFFVIGSCWPLFHDWRMVVFGYVALAIYSYVLDMMINSSRQDTQFIIFTRNGDEICNRIIHETAHSVTRMDGEGFYSHQKMDVLITIVHKREQVQILKLIHEVDPTAFVSQSRAEGVYGNGFNAIKA